jgi:2-polyprenyl-3-methyl-5-hydroxy-6-metoxy-1,4-benzoquinol methylase
MVLADYALGAALFAYLSGFTQQGWYTMQREHYVIRGGLEGRERLRIIARILQPSTLSLMGCVGLTTGMACLDAGCGGGDVSFELARLIGPRGRVLGLDFDTAKVDLATREAAEQRLGNVEFQHADIFEKELAPEFDAVYTRFLLTHLRHPAEALARMRAALRPGGVVIVEDIDFAAHFCYPHSSAFNRYMELYIQVVQRRGGDPYIGPRLPELLLDAGFERVQLQIIQPAGLDGEVKLIAPLTMENIVDAVVAEGLASRAETDHVIEELYALAQNPRTVVSLPRIVQAWGYCPAT